jgi:hypothetical protein
MNAEVLDAPAVDQAKPDRGANAAIEKLRNAMDKESIQAFDNYAAAANFARAKAIETHDLSWFENLGTALTKYAEIVDVDHADLAYTAVIAVDQYLVAKDRANSSYLSSLATGYKSWGDWLSSDKPDTPEIARAKYRLAETTAGQLLAKDPNNVESMSLYIDIATALWSAIDPQTDSVLDKRISAEMITQAKRRIAVEPLKKEQWQGELDRLYTMLGIEKPKVEGRPAKRGAHAA